VFGTYESKILVRDDSGEATLKSRYIHVGPAEAPEMGIFPIQVGPREIEFDTIVKGHYVSDSFYWDLGDGTFVNEPNPRHTYANPGNYTVRVYYFDVYGRLHENSHLFYVDETVYSPQIVGNLANYQEVQIGESVTLDLSGSNDPSGQPMIGYTVDFSNLDLGSTGNDSTTYNTVGIHRIRAYGENGLGLFGKNEFFVNVLNGVGPNPVANADVTSGPAPFSFTLDASGSTGNITKLNWKTYDLSNEFGLPGGTENAIENVTIDTPGFYNFELWVKDDLGNTRISEIEIEVTN
jgi:PKD repeat protein